jgi:hypothetical protein
MLDSVRDSLSSLSFDPFEYLKPVSRCLTLRSLMLGFRV